MDRARLRFVAVVLSVVASWSLAAADEDQEKAVARALAVQRALLQGRTHLRDGDARRAVEVLEARLADVNGNKEYLALLRDAYYAHLKELRRTGQDDQAKLYRERLRILDPKADLDGPAAPAAPVPAGPKVARGSRDTPDAPLAAGELVRRAEEEYVRRHYGEAGKLYEQARRADATCVDACRGHWAYCKLFLAVQTLNQLPDGPADADALAGLEREVDAALALAPDRPEFAKQAREVLGRIHERRGPANEPEAVRGQAADGSGWAAVETANVRVRHRQAAETAEQVARFAERTRAAAFETWSGTKAPAWEPRCEVWLHPTADDYARATGKSAELSGHATIQTTEGRVVGRRLDLRADDPDLLGATLLRETAHVVLAELFPDLPRWADVGMAVQSETRPNVERYLRLVARCRQDGQLKELGAFFRRAEFPGAAEITGFYVQSASLADFLIAEKGPRTFALFVQYAGRYGWEKSLERSYGYRSVAELQERWLRAAGADGRAARN